MKELCEKMLVAEPWGPVPGGGSLEVPKELSKSYREGTAQKFKSMALPYKTKVRKISCLKKVQNHFLTAFLVQKATALSIKKWSLADKIAFFCKKRLPPTGGNGEKHQNLHKTVIRRTFRARS